jgi:hypothetical protein
MGPCSSATAAIRYIFKHSRDSSDILIRNWGVWHFTGLVGANRGFGAMGDINNLGMGMGMDPTQLAQTMQNPLVQQMMQSLMSNPQFMEHVRSNNFGLIVISTRLVFIIVLLWLTGCSIEPKHASAAGIKPRTSPNSDGSKFFAHIERPQHHSGDCFFSSFHQSTR